MKIIKTKESRERKRIREVRGIDELRPETLIALVQYPTFRFLWPFLENSFNEVTFETGERGICCYKDLKVGEEIDICEKRFYFLGIPIIEKTYLKKEKQEIPIYLF